MNKINVTCRGDSYDKYAYKFMVLHAEVIC